MLGLGAIHVLVVLAALLAYQWSLVRPKVDWVPAPVQTYAACPSSTSSQTLMFGATSMLGKYIVESYKRDASICIINYGRSACADCHVNIKGDLRDTRHVGRVLDAFNVDTVLTSVKPPLMDIHYRTFIELNLLSMLELIKLAKLKGVGYFVYVSSIAAAGHYHPHVNASEADEALLYTDYEAPYDVSKRVAEDYLLAAHEEGKFSTVSIRTGGIIGGPKDPYDFYLSSFPFVPSFDIPVVIDANYAGNIGDALYHVDRALHEDSALGGQFYYYTGEHNLETRVADIVSKARGVPVLKLPYWLIPEAIRWYSWLRLDHDVYGYFDLMRMAIVPQSFDQTKFHTTFADFKPRFTVEQALNRLFDKKA